MPRPTLSQAEKDRRAAACREVLDFAAENEAVGSITQCAVIVQGKTSLKIKGALRELLEFKNALPAGDPLRAAYDAVVARGKSTEGMSAAHRARHAQGKGLSIDAMRESRQEYAARPLPSLADSGQRLALELQRGVAATVATPQKQLEGLEECACNEAFETAKASFEERVGIVESVGATNVAEQGYCLISERLVAHTASVWDAEHAKNERAIVFEGALQENYEAEMGKMATPRRAASARGREQAHASRFDAHGGAKAVLEAPVALTKAPGSFVSGRDSVDDGFPGLKAIADAVEAEQKIRVDSRVICFPLRKSDLYGRLRPTALSEGRNLRLAKKVKQLDKGRSMLLTLRPDGKPQLLVVGRGFYRPLFINVTPPKIMEADREQRLRTKSTVANSYDHYQRYLGMVEKSLGNLRRVIVELGLNGHDVAEFVSKIVDQIDGRSLDGAPGEAPKGGTVSDDEDDVDLRLGPCPEGVDEDAWAVVRKDLEGGGFAKFAQMNDFAARVRSMVGNFRAAGPVKKCGNNAPAPAPAVEVSGGAPPPQQDDVPRGGTRPRGRGSSKFAHGREASSDKFLKWSFAPLAPDWASKVELGADAVKAIGPTERLVDYWLKVSRSMAEALHQEFEVLSERDAPADNISPLLDAVAGVVGKRKAPDAVAAAPGAKRSRGVDVTA